jgi:hypothetical protein
VEKSSGWVMYLYTSANPISTYEPSRGIAKDSEHFELLTSAKIRFMKIQDICQLLHLKFHLFNLSFNWISGCFCFLTCCDTNRRVAFQGLERIGEMLKSAHHYSRPIGRKVEECRSEERLKSLPPIRTMKKRSKDGDVALILLFIPC